jgi:hypothetical protein
MMMSSVDHLGDAVLIAPHRAKHALSAAAAWHGNPLAPGRGREREGRRAASLRRQCAHPVGRRAGRRRRSRTPPHVVVETYRY